MNNLENNSTKCTSIAGKELGFNTNKKNEALSLLSPSRNPFEIAPIIQCILGFLPLEQIKKCRFVSKEWNRFAEPFLRKRSQISIGYPNDFNNSNMKFKKRFRKSECQIPFNALQLWDFNGKSSPWTVSGLKVVFRDWEMQLKELTISRIAIQGVRPFSDTPFNMSALLKETNVAKLIFETLSDFNWQFSLKDLPHIKHLQLENCSVIFNKDSILAATHVELTCCELSFENDSDKNTLNTFIDFEVAKTVIFRHTDNIKLDMKGKFELDLLELDLLELENSSILNWETSNWMIGRLYFSDVDFQGITDMQVREMKVYSSEYTDTLLDIPETVEKLTCKDVRISSPASFPNLKHFAISGKESLEMLKFVKSWPLLKSLEITGYVYNRHYYESFHILSDWIPQNLDRFCMNGSVNINGENIVNVEILVFRWVNSTCILDTFKTLKAQKIIWVVGQYAKYTDVIQCISSLEENVTAVAVGEFKWSNDEAFTKSPLAQRVDMKSAFYLFKNGKGTAISKDHFDKMMEV